MHDKRYKELAVKYFNNSATPEEAEVVLLWFRTPAGRAYLLNIFNSDSKMLNRNHLHQLVPELESDKLYHSLWSKIQATKRTARSIPSVPGRRTGLFVKAAAAFFVVVLASAFTFLFEQRKPIIVESNEPVIFKTGPEENRALLLSDGSSIRMNAGTELVVSGSYLKGSREVTLNGEAYFDIKHDPENPFIIHSNQTSIEVLGTEFNVRSYNSQDNVQVAVVSGKVLFNNDIHGQEVNHLILGAGQYAYLNLTSGIFEKDDVAIENYLAWKNRFLVFDELSLAQVCQQLYRLYEARCSFAGSGVESLLITAKLTDPSLEKVSEVIALTHNIRYQKSSNRIHWTYSN